MQTKPTEELYPVQGHSFGFAFITIIPEPESNRCVADIQDALVGDGHPVDVLAQVLEYMLRTGQ